MALNTRDEKAVQHKPKSLPNTGSHPARPDPNPNSPSATVRSTYQHHKPFGPFSQSPAATTRTPNGSGQKFSVSFSFLPAQHKPKPPASPAS